VPEQVWYAAQKVERGLSDEGPVLQLEYRASWYGLAPPGLGPDLEALGFDLQEQRARGFAAMGGPRYWARRDDGVSVEWQPGDGEDAPAMLTIDVQLPIDRWDELVPPYLASLDLGPNADVLPLLLPHVRSAEMFCAMGDDPRREVSVQASEMEAPLLEEIRAAMRARGVVGRELEPGFERFAISERDDVSVFEQPDMGSMGASISRRLE
jgi:hypothetical protein